MNRNLVVLRMDAFYTKVGCRICAGETYVKNDKAEGLGITQETIEREDKAHTKAAGH